ncbi:MAG: hypothetical protein J6O61_18785 [Butyrivibrio sp.]|nr:hypothetical protein [Butyrivibrio sp.]
MVSTVSSAIISFFLKTKVTAGFDSALFRLGSMTILFGGLVCLFYIILKVIFSAESKDEKTKAISDNKYLEAIKTKYCNVFNTPLKVFLLCFFSCMFFWLPYFLYEFPGIMTADSLVQYEQIAGLRPYSNHHPIVHTLLIKLFFNIGFLVTGNVVKAISFYTVFQMIFFSISLSVLVMEIRILSGKKNLFLEMIAIIFFALVPFNAVFAVTIWKDIPFAALTILFVCMIIELVNGRGSWIGFIVLGVLFSLFRSNAWIAFILWSAVCVYAFRKNIKMVLVSVFTVLIIVSIIKGPVFDLFGVERPDFVESLSVPIAQIARVLVNDRTLTAKEQELVDMVIDTTYIHELYAPDYADNIKELVRAGNVKYLEENKFEYFKLWAGLMVRYFGDYVSAWIDLLGGYIYPDFSYAVGDIDGIMGNDYGLVWMPQIGGKVVVKLKEIVIKLGGFIPIYGMFWSIGTYSWILFATLFVSIKKKIKVPEMWLLLFMLGTLLIAAPNLEFRYAYSLALVWPLLISRANSSNHA